MTGRLACLLMLMAAACSPQAPDVTVARETVGLTQPESTAWADPGDLAREARAFYFAQADLYLSGASPAEGGPLADVLRVMGRDDLVSPPLQGTPAIACPQRGVEPVDLVAQSVTNSRAVILLSEKTAPEQTAFIHALAARLVPGGFTTYADDGLSFGPGGAADPDIPMLTEGLVTRHPRYGRLLRDLKARGVALVDAGIWWSGPSELAALTPEQQLARRQSALVSQVRRRILLRQPDAQILLHTEQGPENAALTEDVARATGSKPAVVALVRCIEAGADPAFLPEHGEGPGGVAGADLTVAIPVPQRIEGRQPAARDDGSRTARVPAAFAASASPVLIEARRLNDPDLAVPEDRLMLFPGETLPLLLPPGSYRVEAWTRDGPLGPAIVIDVS